jgi:hypothetical protein
MGPTEIALSIVVFQQGDYVCAQCLEYDIAAQAKNVEDCLYEFGRVVMGHVAIAIENGLEPLKELPRAPQKFWRSFSESKITYPATPQFPLEIANGRRVVLEQPAIRIAPALAA